MWEFNLNEFLAAIADLLDGIIRGILQLLTFDPEIYLSISSGFYTGFQLFKVFGAGIALVVFVWQCFRALVRKEPIEDTPLELAVRLPLTLLFIAGGGYIYEYIMEVTAYPYNMFVSSTTGMMDVNTLPSFVDLFTNSGSYDFLLGSGIFSFAKETASLLFCIFISLFFGLNLVCLLLQCFLRFAKIGILLYTYPLPTGFCVSKSKSQIYFNWLEMFVGQCILMFISAWFVVIVCQCFSIPKDVGDAEAPGAVVRLLMAYAICKVGIQAEDILQKLGIKVTNGANFLGDSLMAIKTVGRVGHAAGGAVRSIVGSPFGGPSDGGSGSGFSGSPALGSSAAASSLGAAKTAGSAAAETVGGAAAKTAGSAAATVGGAAAKKAAASTVGRAAGGAVGAVGGPVGSVVGSVAGGVIAGAAGKVISDAVNSSSDLASMREAQNSAVASSVIGAAQGGHTNLQKNSNANGLGDIANGDTSTARRTLSGIAAQQFAGSSSMYGSGSVEPDTNSPVAPVAGGSSDGVRWANRNGNLGGVNARLDDVAKNAGIQWDGGIQPDGRPEMFTGSDDVLGDFMGSNYSACQTEDGKPLYNNFQDSLVETARHGSPLAAATALSNRHYNLSGNDAVGDALLKNGVGEENLMGDYASYDNNGNLRPGAFSDVSAVTLEDGSRVVSGCYTNADGEAFDFSMTNGETTAEPGARQVELNDGQSMTLTATPQTTSQSVTDTSGVQQPTQSSGVFIGGTPVPVKSYVSAVENQSIGGRETGGSGNEAQDSTSVAGHTKATPQSGIVLHGEPVHQSGSSVSGNVTGSSGNTEQDSTFVAGRFHANDTNVSGGATPESRIVLHGEPVHQSGSSVSGGVTGGSGNEAQDSTFVAGRFHVNDSNVNVSGGATPESGIVLNGEPVHQNGSSVSGNVTGSSGNEAQSGIVINGKRADGSSVGGDKPSASGRYHATKLKRDAVAGRKTGKPKK